MADSATLPPVFDECDGDVDVSATHWASSIAMSAGPGYYVRTTGQPGPKLSSDVKRPGKVLMLLLLLLLLLLQQLRLL